MLPDAQAARVARIATLVFSAVLVFGVGHFAGIVTTAVLRGHFVYDFHGYSMGVVGALMVVPSVVGLRQVGRLRRRDPAARRTALRASLVLLAASVPMLPMQSGRLFVIFGGIIASLAGVAAITLAASRSEFADPS